MKTRVGDEPILYVEEVGWFVLTDGGFMPCEYFDYYDFYND